VTRNKNNFNFIEEYFFLNTKYLEYLNKQVPMHNVALYIGHTKPWVNIVF
jgi:hypothetical protein